MPEAYGADGSITTIWTASRNAAACSASHSRTQPPVRPGASPSSDPGPSREQSTNEVSHGSERCQVTPSNNHRTDRNRVSSIPSRVVGVGSGSHLAAAATRALCAVGQDTPYSAATSDTARFPTAIASATLVRSLSVTRALGRITTLSCVNDRRGHNTSTQARRRLRHHSCVCCPDAGRSLIRRSGRSFTREVKTPHAGHGASAERISTMTLTWSGSSRSTLTTSNSSSIPSRTAVPFDMLVASLLDVVRDQQHVGATSPNQSGAPLNFVEIP
jgi:hypothetical protein